ncbi:hypothetical protein JR064_06700 [Xanthomonas sp. CFBP 8703]|uniref:Uncharacterized protein n=1 Tax=Xanthomonas bonasiae TaxID=2810351 RepID=A0ABS3AZQ9_9XANT|nr:hypothetical protein [Xanthomonas bonasiae]MBN6101855.1 hypothetical protein [Xanthomonas bonasiae]
MLLARRREAVLVEVRLGFEYGVHRCGGDGAMPLSVERYRREMSIEDDDIDLFAAAAGAVSHKARLDLVAIGQASTEDLDPVVSLTLACMPRCLIA